MCPLTFGKYIQAVTGKKVSNVIRIDPQTRQPNYVCEGDELVLPLYEEVKKRFNRPTDEQLQYFARQSDFALPEIFYPHYLHNGSITRKWGKEKIELFYSSDPFKAFTAYLLYRQEESIYSDRLIQRIYPILKEIDNILPDFIEVALTSGSHSRVWGGGAGNLMSWLDSDVDIDLLVNADNRADLEGKLAYLSEKLGGNPPVDWGKLSRHKIIEIKRKIDNIDVPISGYFDSLDIRYCIFFTTMNDFYNGETEYMPFLMVNGTLLGERIQGNYKEIQEWGLKKYPMPPPEEIVAERC